MTGTRIKTIPRAVYRRIVIVLLMACLGSFVRESFQNDGLVSVSGEIIRSEYIYGKEAYTVRFRVNGIDRNAKVRVGVLDVLHGLGRLHVGDSFPMAVSPAPGARAVPDTLTGRYGITLSMSALAAIFFLATGWGIVTGRLEVSGH